MADYREGLHLIPAHMHEGIKLWIERGEPHPVLHGSFQRAVLLHDLMEAAARADWENQQALLHWADFLHNYAPSGCHGSMERLLAWYAAFHPTPDEPNEG